MTSKQNYKTAQDHVQVYANEMERLNNEINRLNVRIDRMVDEGATDDKRIAVAAQCEMLTGQREALRPRLNEWYAEMVKWEGDNGW